MLTASKSNENAVHEKLGFKKINTGKYFSNNTIQYYYLFCSSALIKTRWALPHCLWGVELLHNTLKDLLTRRKQVYDIFGENTHVFTTFLIFSAVISLGSL